MEMEQRAVFATRLGQLRIDRKMSQEELSIQVQIDRATIAKYETKKRIPSYEHLTALAKFFEVSTDYLLGITSTSTKNIKTRAICEYIGLSQATVEALHCLSETPHKDLFSTIDFLLNDLKDVRTGEKDGIDIEYTFLYSVNKFFENQPTGKQNFKISQTQKMLDECYLEMIVEQILRNDLVETLESMKEDYPYYMKYKDMRREIFSCFFNGKEASDYAKHNPTKE